MEILFDNIASAADRGGSPGLLLCRAKNFLQAHPNPSMNIFLVFIRAFVQGVSVRARTHTLILFPTFFRAFRFATRSRIFGEDFREK